MSVYRGPIQDASILPHQEESGAREAGGVTKGKCRRSVYNEKSEKHFVDYNKSRMNERQ